MALPNTSSSLDHKHSTKNAGIRDVPVRHLSSHQCKYSRNTPKYVVRWLPLHHESMNDVLRRYKGKGTNHSNICPKIDILFVQISQVVLLNFLVYVLAKMEQAASQERLRKNVFTSVHRAPFKINVEGDWMCTTGKKLYVP